MTRWERLKAGLCPNCAQKGPHFVPPSDGGKRPGFFVCASIDQEEQAEGEGEANA